MGATGGSAVSSGPLDLLLAVLSAAGLLVWLALAAVTGRRLLHILQLEEYELARFWAWVRAHPSRAVSGWQAWAAVALGLMAVVLADDPSSPLLSGLVTLPLGALALWRRPRATVKKPLRWTPRALLLAATAAALGLLLLAAGAAAWALGLNRPLPSAGFFLALAALGVAPAPLLTAATVLWWPAQALVKRWLVWRAAARLRQRQDLVIIGVTGSYGKTSVKNYLTTLLGARYRVCQTAASINTPVGVARTIHGALRPEHQVFVVEMGAYVLGNIRTLAQFVRPRIGVLTAVGENHLERFGSVEAIARTKYELIEALPADGLAVFNADNPRCRELAARTRHVRVRTYGLDPAHGPEVTASAIRTGPDGTRFVLHLPGEAPVPVRMALLGRHNVSNVLAAAAVAQELGLSAAEIAAAAERLAPVEHRLQLRQGAGGVTVIDDAYNSNPDGARAALAVLAEFPGRKILVTPGMVELGPMLEQRHREFGAEAARVCDLILLVGRRRTAGIAEGALAAGYPADRLHVVGSLAEATAKLGQLVRPGDVVLFENDLPDQYSE